MRILIAEDEWTANIRNQSARMSKLVEKLVALSRLDETKPIGVILIWEDSAASPMKVDPAAPVEGTIRRSRKMLRRQRMLKRRRMLRHLKMLRRPKVLRHRKEQAVLEECSRRNDRERSFQGLCYLLLHIYCTIMIQSVIIITDLCQCGQCGNISKITAIINRLLQ